jgi:antitoxin MazE
LGNCAGLYGIPPEIFINGSEKLDKCINIVYIIMGAIVMETIIRKWGNSLGIRIPNFIVREFSLKDGSFVEIKDTGNEIIIKPKKENTLSKMLDSINEHNIHEEIETDGPVGKEIW